MDKYVVAPPSGSTNNSVGAADRKWKKGFFEELPNWQEYLAESTGYGIVSGCEPTISGLTVTVGAGIVHLADGTRKEIASTNITLDAANASSPREDYLYIDSDGIIKSQKGTLGTSAIAGSRTYTITANAVSGDIISFGEYCLTCGSIGIEGAWTFSAGANASDTAENIATAINNKVPNLYLATATANTVTVSEVVAGAGNNPAEMVTNGTISVTNGDLTASTPPVVPINMSENQIVICGIFIPANGTSGEIRNNIRTNTTNIFNVRQFGAIGDGEHDDTNSIQSAIDYCSQTGGTLIVPTGQYKINTNGLVLKSNIKIIGVGNAELISNDEFAQDTSDGYMLASDVVNGIINVEIKNITFRQLVSNYVQTVSVIKLKSAKNVIIEQCKFIHWSSDAILIAGRGFNNYGRTPENITIRQCYFDGVNKNTRQAISANACKGLFIEDNYITRTTRNDMPGAIDLEPNKIYEELKDVYIRGNIIKDHRNVGIAVHIMHPQYKTAWNPHNINIEDNYVEGDAPNGFGIYVYLNNDDGASENHPFNAISIKNNIVKDVGINVSGINGAQIENNTIMLKKSTSIRAILISRIQNGGNVCQSANISIINNQILGVANRSEGNDTILIYNTCGIEFSQNYINDNVSSTAIPVRFTCQNVGDFSNISIKNNIVIEEQNPDKNMFAVSVKAAPDLSFGNIVFEGNGKTRLEWNSQYYDLGIDYGTSAPSTGSYRQGAKRYNIAPSVGGYAGWICTTAGSPGTWKGFGKIES